MRARGLITAMLSSKLVAVLSLSVACGSVLYADSKSTLDGPKIVTSLHETYGKRAAKRGEAWLKLMASDTSSSDQEALEKVNRFFNMLHFIDDIDLWGENNYWATPVEFIGANGGDCEDYSIAKYFSLLEMGIADEKMRITMVKAVNLNQYHMVLAYYATPASIPVILDNLDGEIKPATKRNDLIPIFSFNGSQLWLNKDRGSSVSSGNSSRLTRWRDLRQRINTAKLKQPKLNLEF
ncbi:transglutaminase-like cysteine peptidase [Paraglaciecola sp. 2405UD69-4]|uniref:transglutaminase-like cysteine peptidase n=1 Tax=Paraglaciecola sp. 2405UD69-4 TaxID=3391836 RepID=UPI0039C96D08